MISPEEFKQAYEDYIAFNKELTAGQGLLSGILGVFGLNKGAANDPGHEKFYLEMKAAMESVCEEQPDQETADNIADVIFHARYDYAEEQVSPFMFYAVESTCIDLIPFLSPEKVRQIYTRYKADNPKSRCVPAQKKVLAALKKAAEG